MRPELRLAATASRQYQVFHRNQALAAGFSSSGIKRRVDAGLWEPMHRGVFIATGIKVGWEQALMAALLGCGPDAAGSCGSAALVWGVTDAVIRPHVTVKLEIARKVCGVVVHRSRELDAAFHKGFRVTNPMRTLLDLSSYLSDEPLEIALDNAWRKGLLEPMRFARYLDLPRNRARKGSGPLRAMVGLRKPGRPIGSGGETKLFRFLRRYGLPTPVPQHPIETRSGFRYADFAYPEKKIAIEFDSLEWHSSRLSLTGERIRRNELEEAAPGDSWCMKTTVSSRRSTR